MITSFLLALVSCSDKAALPRNNERVAIIDAVLARQPDLAADRKAFLADHPGEKGYFEDLADFRICVTQETAGSGRNHQMILSERRDASDRRFAITSGVNLPSHLRWDNILAFCPSGSLRLSTPVITGEQARVFVENRSSGWLGSGGWGGEVILRRENGQWLVVQEINRWQA